MQGRRDRKRQRPRQASDYHHEQAALALWTIRLLKWLIISVTILGIGTVCAVYYADQQDTDLSGAWDLVKARIGAYMDPTPATSPAIQTPTALVSIALSSTPSPAPSPTQEVPASTPTALLATSSTPSETPEPVPTVLAPAETSTAEAVVSPESTRKPKSLAVVTPVSTASLAGPARNYPGHHPLDVEEIERWVVHYTNIERGKAGLPPFKHDVTISRIARAHSENMVQFGYGHVVLGLGTNERAQAAGYNCRAYRDDGSYSTGLSENIHRRNRVTEWTRLRIHAYGTTEYGDWNPKKYFDEEEIASLAVNAWMNSPGHRANILDEEKVRIGVGIAIEESMRDDYVRERVYATQNFSACE